MADLRLCSRHHCFLVRLSFSLGCPQGTWTKEGHPIRWFMLFLPFTTNRNWPSSFFSGGLFGSLGWKKKRKVLYIVWMFSLRYTWKVIACCWPCFSVVSHHLANLQFFQNARHFFFFFQCSGCNGIRFSWLPWEQQHLAHFYCWAYSFYTHPNCALLSLLTN